MSGLSIVKTGAVVRSEKCLRVGLALSDVSQKRTPIRRLKQWRPGVQTSGSSGA
jgi:hypothetical protein